MDTFKMIRIAAICALSISMQACGNTNFNDMQNMVSMEEYESKVNEYKKLNERQAAIIQQNIENDAVLNEIVQELRMLTTATNTLRLNVESGTASMEKPDEIKMRLKELRQKLAAAGKEKSSDNTKHYIETIQNLQKIIDQKEKEIDALKVEIQQKDSEIKQKAQTIKAQEETIIQQQRDMIIKQMEAWYSMGEELYNIAQVLPVVKGKKDKNNMENTKLYILYRAKDCYLQAEKMGHTDAKSKVSKVNSEIASL